MQPSPRHYSTMRPNVLHSVDPKEIELRSAEWYWGKITREEARNVLLGKPEGSFLVRDALSKEGEYTLTLIKDGTEKLIKICRQNDKYGFVDCKFNSVVELVNYYKVNSLKYYNKMLDINLRYPVIRPIEEEDAKIMPDDNYSLFEWYYKTTEAYNQYNVAYKTKYEDFKSSEKSLHVLKSDGERYNSAIKMLKESIESLHKNYASIASDGTMNDIISEEKEIQLNESKQKTILYQWESDFKEIIANIEKKKEEYHTYERQMNSLRAELVPLGQTRTKLFAELRRRGLTDEDIERLTRLGPLEFCRKLEKFKNQPHKIESFWLYDDCNRFQAEELLHDAPTGTFLIRSRPTGDYALSISCNDRTNHCLIYKTDQGYGFSAPYNIYTTLKQLVENYATKPLELHNEELTTTMKIPVGYWLQNKADIIKQLEDEQQNGSELEADAVAVTAAVTTAAAAAAAAAAVEGGGGGVGSGSIGCDVSDAAAVVALDGQHLQSQDFEQDHQLVAPQHRFTASEPIPIPIPTASSSSLSLSLSLSTDARRQQRLLRYHDSSLELSSSLTDAPANSLSTSSADEAANFSASQ